MQQLEESIANVQQVETMMEQKLAKPQPDWECRQDEENSKLKEHYQQKQQQKVREIEQHYDQELATMMDSFDWVVAVHEKENEAVQRLIRQEQAEKASLEQQMRASQGDGELEKNDIRNNSNFCRRYTENRRD